MGVKVGIKHTPHKPREAVITDDAKAWVVHLACSRPKDLGYAAELWTRSALARHVRWEAVATGFPALAKVGKVTVQRILTTQELQPHKIRYYLDRLDPDFETKVQKVLLVYKKVAMEKEAAAGGSVRSNVITVSVDEKPGVQAIADTAPDLLPVPGEHPTFARDHEYIRHGTWSILASLNLLNGHIIARVEERHRSIEFIGLLKDLDAYYPPECTIHLILDNHSSHISKEMRTFLAQRPNRFKYLLTPTHGSWLNIVERLFGKMARNFLKQIRVSSREKLRQRFLKGIEEINQSPVAHYWNAFQTLEETESF